MTYVVVASVLRNVTTSDGDCTVIQELALFLSWTQVNSRAATAITTAKFFPLTILYYKRVIDQLGSIVCEGSRALGVTAYLIGQGSSLQSVNDWVQTYSSDTFVLKVPNNPRWDKGCCCRRCRCRHPLFVLVCCVSSPSAVLHVQHCHCIEQSRSRYHRYSPSPGLLCESYSLLYHRRSGFRSRRQGRV
jgi:hypothetical protein